MTENYPEPIGKMPKLGSIYYSVSYAAGGEIRKNYCNCDSLDEFYINNGMAQATYDGAVEQLNFVMKTGK